MTPKVRLHPLSVKHLKRGHPWVIKDQFTKKFPKEELFLKGLDAQNKVFCTLLHDPTHPQIKARLWKDEDLDKLIHTSFLKRKQLNLEEKRNTYFLSFGEADFLPGLFIIKFRDQILLQYYASSWLKLEKKLLKAIKKALSDIFELNSCGIWSQQRNKGQDLSFKKLFGKTEDELVINEFGVQYLVKFSKTYDLGFYPDMSSFREKIFKANLDNKAVLNLFSYSGAYSLLSLKKGAKEVYSVDSAQMAHDWLEENLKLNTELDPNKNFCVKSDVLGALKTFEKENKTFDLIICDPPSFSSDGQKSQPALKNYNKLLPLISSLLSEKGKAYVFLNTHKVSWQKFSDTIEEVLKGSRFKISQRLKLGQDCPTLKVFPEGDYLKGLEISRF